MVEVEETALRAEKGCEEVQRIPGDGGSRSWARGHRSSDVLGILVFELHQDDFYVSGNNVELRWLQEHLGARLKLKPAEPMGPESQYSYLRTTRQRVDAETIHIAPRETCIQNVLDILGLGENPVQVDANTDGPDTTEERRQ